MPWDESNTCGWESIKCEWQWHFSFVIVFQASKIYLSGIIHIPFFGLVLLRLPSLVSIDSKYADLVHVREFCNHHYKDGQRVEEQHRMLIVCCVRSNQVPACIRFLSDNLLYHSCVKNIKRETIGCKKKEKNINLRFILVQLPKEKLDSNNNKESVNRFEDR